VTVTALLALLVPRPWSVAQARQAERRLQELIDAVWHVHGEAMAAALLAPAPAASPPRASARPRACRRSSPVRGSLVRFVPTDWSGEQALRVVHVLHLAIAAVWEVADPAPAVLLPTHTDRSDEDDEIPF
jgi:hypothetical protein